MKSEAAQKLADDEAAVAAWRHPGDVLDATVQDALISQLADALTPVLQFIAKGRLGGTMHHRAWVWLHETRLDLINAESVESYAARAGLSSARVHHLITEFRELIPAYRSPNQKSAASRAKMRDSARKRHFSSKIDENRTPDAPPPPPGDKESFFHPPS